METNIVVPIENEDQGMLPRRRHEIIQLIREVFHYHNMFEERGLFILGKEKGPESNRTVGRWFQPTFGTSSIVCWRVWKLLQLDRNSSKSMTLDHLLWGLMVLKV